MKVLLGIGFVLGNICGILNKTNVSCVQGLCDAVRQSRSHARVLQTEPWILFEWSLVYVSFTGRATSNSTCAV